MLTFLRKIRRSLIESNSPRKYLLYAIGEIALVVIGILIALQINNWNENRKSKNEFRQSMLVLAEEIRNDTSIIQDYITTLQYQESAAAHIIRVLESEKMEIRDSIKFIASFMRLSNTPQVEFNTEIWDEIRRSGLHKTFGDPAMVSSIQDYYHGYKRAAKNFENAYKVRIEMRELKYTFLRQHDLDLIRANPPQAPSAQAYTSIYNSSRVLDLTKSIYYTSTLFTRHFQNRKRDAVAVLESIEKEIVEIGKEDE